MRRLRSILPLLAAALATVGCASDQQYLDSSESAAVRTAVTRARFELDCPAATGTVLSREVVQPAFVGPRMMGIPRAEYTVGVSGCDRRATYVVLCPEGSGGCFAADGGGRAGG
jgi:hypothetical protein